MCNPPMKLWMILFCFVITLSAVATAQQCGANEHCAWVAKLLTSLEDLKPGMTRVDAEKILTTDGGISTHTRQTYTSRECGFIKVDLEFAPSPNDRSEDRITSVSKPYLAQPIFD